MTGADPFPASERDQLIGELAAWCAIQSVSADPDCHEHVQRSAAHLASLMENAGLSSEVVELPGSKPAVIAAWTGAGPDAPTVTIYGHHDVQPVEPLHAWVTPPFTPTLRDDCLYARGASDDKGNVHLCLAAVRHLLRERRLGVNVRFVVEGEEEIFSPKLQALLCAQRDQLRCDIVLIADAGMHALDVPTLSVAVRGILSIAIAVRTASADVHSGSYGGTIANAAMSLAQLLTGLQDPEGRITIPGWYDDADPPSSTARTLVAELPFDPERYLVEIGATALVGESGYTPLERVGLRPSVDVHGLSSGYSGPGLKTIIPAEAQATLSFRLVEGQDPDRLAQLLRTWVAEHAPPGATIEVVVLAKASPYRSPIDHFGNQTLTDAITWSWKVPPLYLFEGGTGPQAILADALCAPIVNFGVSLPDDNPPGPNERLQLAAYFRGLAAIVYFFEALPGVAV